MEAFSLSAAEPTDHASHLVGRVLPHSFAQAPARPWHYYAMQRCLDVLVSSIALLAFAPIMITIALIIRCDSAGPALFRQQRVGKNGRLFTFYKFRTMWCDARTRFPELYAYQYSEDEVRSMSFKLRNDPRLTRFGRHLRKTSLDELPNFINVLLGTMTLVGPRPEIPEMVPYYTEEQQIKFSVKPGVTGMAQISGRGNLTLQDTISADLRYCHERSLRCDIAILFGTVKSIVIRNGAF